MMKLKNVFLQFVATFILMLPATVLIAADLHEPHVGTVGEFSPEVGGECTWHFVHNQLPHVKGQPNGPNAIEVTYGVDGGGVIVETREPFKRNKKVDHYNITIANADPLVLEAAKTEIGEGKLVLSDVSCIEFEEVLLQCPCWNDFTASGFLDVMEEATTCNGPAITQNATVIAASSIAGGPNPPGEEEGVRFARVSLFSAVDVNICNMVIGAGIDTRSESNLSDTVFEICTAELLDMIDQLQWINCP